MHIVVHGAGVFGLSAALALLEDGHEVTVHEPQQPGAGASGRAAGIVSTVCHEEDDIGLVQRTRAWLQDAGLLQATGSLTVVGPEHQDRLQATVRRMQKAGESPQVLAPDAVMDRFPALHLHADEAALWVPADGVVEPGDLVQALLDRVVGAGADVMRSPVQAEVQVAAAGAWTGELVSGWGATLPVAAFRTQAAHVAGVCVPVAVHDAVHGFYFRPDGQGLLVGDGTRLHPHDPRAYNERGDPEFEHSVAERLQARVPDAAQARLVNSWAGLCVGTPDARPVCGALAPGRFVLSGDNGHGVMRCVALGERLAAAVSGQEAPSTSPDRFADPAAPFEMREGFAW